jgi:TPR repeat protein
VIKYNKIADNKTDERTTITERIFKKRKDNGEEYFKIGLKYWNLHTPEGYQASIDWFYKSAKKKNPEASYYIGLMYFKGYGLPIDENKAFQWYSTACRHGEKYTPATFATFLRGRKKYQFTQVNKPLGMFS